MILEQTDRINLLFGLSYIDCEPDLTRPGSYPPSPKLTIHVAFAVCPHPWGQAYTTVRICLINADSIILTGGAIARWNTGRTSIRTLSCSCIAVPTTTSGESPKTGGAYRKSATSSIIHTTWTPIRCTRYSISLISIGACSTIKWAHSIDAADHRIPRASTIVRQTLVDVIAWHSVPRKAWWTRTAPKAPRSIQAWHHRISGAGFMSG